MLSWHDLAEWLLRMALGGGLVLLLAWFVLRWISEPARRQRLGEWSVAAALLLAVLCLTPGWLALPILPHESPVPDASSTPVAFQTSDPMLDDEDFDDPLGDGAFDDAGVDVGEGAVVDPVVGEVSTSPAARPSTEPTWWEMNWAQVLLAIWAGGTLFYVGRLLLALLALQRYRRRALPVPDAVRARFEAMSIDIPRACVLMCPRLQSPLSFGLFRPTVILPVGLCDPGAVHRLHWVLAHEVAHLRRRDAWTSLLFNLAQPLFWFLPWFWSLRHQVELCQEYLADEATVRTCEELPTDYADFLLRWARKTRVPTGALGLWGGSSDLYQRIKMLLNRSRSLEPACPRRWSWLVGTSLVAVAFVLGSLTLTAAAASPQPQLEHPCCSSVQPQSTDTEKEQPNEPAEKPGEPMLPGISEPMEKQPEVITPPKSPTSSPRPAKGEELLKQLTKNVDPKQVQAAKEGVENVKKIADQLKNGWQQLQQQRPPVAQGPLAPKGKPVAHVNYAEARLGAQFEKPNPTVMKMMGQPTDQGLFIEDIKPDSPAARLGLREWDVLLKIDGKKVPNNVDEFSTVLRDIKLEQPVELVVLRKNKKETLKSVRPAESKNETARRQNDKPNFFGQPGPAQGPGGKPGNNGPQQQRAGMIQPNRRSR